MPFLLGLLAVVLILLNVALFIFALFALIVWGIMDLVNVGPNFWNIFWIVVSSLYLLSNIRHTQK